MATLGAREFRYLRAVGLVTVLCLILFLLRIAITGSYRYWFIPQNLALAWASLIFAWLLVARLKEHRWLSWQNASLSGLWLAFLPNSWYVLTDFVHVRVNGDISQLYDIVLMTSLVVSGFTLGFTSLYLVHLQLIKRLGSQISGVLVSLILLLSSFAIYLGRDLRWNSWDVVADPSGLILNVSDRVVDPFGHPRALNVTVLFFVLIGTLYLALWIWARPTLRRAQRPGKT